VSARRRGLAIGAVLAELEPEFPDLTISKIRFLESEGLVTPERTASGYRLFSAADVERLRYVLTAQRDRFWPLKVIREALDAMDRGLEPDPGPTGAPGRPVVPSATPDPDLPTPAQLSARSRLRLTAAELQEAAGIDSATLVQLATYSLVRADESGHYDDTALAVARSAAALAGHGVEARHLRMIRTAADREVGLVRQIVVPALAAQGRKGVRPGGDPTAEVLHHLIALHTALVKAELVR
jgi:DNA-binding transcriptional MerR regulator